MILILALMEKPAVELRFFKFISSLYILWLNALSSPEK